MPNLFLKSAVFIALFISTSMAENGSATTKTIDDTKGNSKTGGIRIDLEKKILIGDHLPSK